MLIGLNILEKEAKDIYSLTDCFCQLNVSKNIRGIDCDIVIIIIVIVVVFFMLLGDIIIRAIHMFLICDVIRRLVVVVVGKSNCSPGQIGRAHV